MGRILCKERKVEALKIARDLCYGADIRKAIKDSTNDFEIDRALITGRKRMTD